VSLQVKTQVWYWLKVKVVELVKIRLEERENRSEEERNEKIFSLE
jgi:hypothetical protein